MSFNNFKLQMSKRFLTLIDNEQDIGEYYLKNIGVPELINKGQTMYSIQK